MWDLEATWREEQERGAGMEAEEEIVDWKPFRYFSEFTRTPVGQMEMTMELTPRDDVTHVSFRMRPRGTPGQIAAAAHAFQATEQVMHCNAPSPWLVANSERGGHQASVSWLP